MVALVPNLVTLAHSLGEVSCCGRREAGWRCIEGECSLRLRDSPHSIILFLYIVQHGANYPRTQLNLGFAERICVFRMALTEAAIVLALLRRALYYVVLL